MEKAARSSFLALVIVFIFLASSKAWTAQQIEIGAASPEAKSAAQWQNKLEAGVLDEISAGKPSDLVVFFKGRPDLSKAKGLSWKERGRLVYGVLKENNIASQSKANGILSAHPGTYGRAKRFLAVNAMALEGAASASLVESLARLPQVESIRKSRTYKLIVPVATTRADAPSAVPPWGIRETGAPDLWSKGVDGSGIVVANIDTGVRYTHEALLNQYRGKKEDGTFDHHYSWYDPNNPYNTSPVDYHGHGSHTMGTMVGNNGVDAPMGMAPGARWIACAGCNGTSCQDIALMECADFILAPWNLNKQSPDPDKRPQVVNNSWGGTCDSWYQPAVEAWKAAGIFPAFSAGNSGPACETMGSPGGYADSFASGAFAEALNIAGFSSRGPYCDGTQMKPDVAAPGVSVYSSTNTSDTSYEAWDGTSMASPHTAGLVALLWSSKPWLKGQVDTTTLMIRDSATRMVDLSCDTMIAEVGVPNNVWGWGRINATSSYSWDQGSLIMSPSVQRKIGAGGATITYPITLFNRSASSITATISAGFHSWNISFSQSSILVPSMGQASFEVYHTIPGWTHLDEESVSINAAWSGGNASAQVSSKNLFPNRCQCPEQSVSLFSEDFEGTFPPAGWNVVTSVGGPWLRNDTVVRDNYTGGSGFCAVADSDDFGDGMDTELRTPNIDLSGVSAGSKPYLFFRSDFNDYGSSDDGYVDVSTDSGVTWTNLLHYEKADYRGPRTETVDLSSYAGQNITLRFRYVAPAWDWWWQVDDVQVNYCGSPLAGTVICPNEDHACPGRYLQTVSLWNFEPTANTFNMTYSASTGTVSGPATVGPVASGGSASIPVNFSIPNLSGYKILDYLIKATGTTPASTAVGTVRRTIRGWKNGAIMPFPAMDNPVLAYNGEVFALGGYGSSGQCAKFNPNTGSWSPLATQPTPNISFPRGGILGTNPSGQATFTLFPDATGDVTGTVYVYNLVTNSWSSLAMPSGLPSNGIWNPALVNDVTGKVGYISGGATIPGAGNLISLFRYRPSTNSIDALPGMTTARSFHAGWLWKNKLCVAGGVNPGGNVLNSTQCFDFAKGAWNPENTDLPPLPGSWWGMAYDSLDGKPFLAGGIVDGDLSNLAAYFDEASNKWVMVSAAPKTVYRVSGAAVDSRFYLLGGASSGFDYQSHDQIFMGLCGPPDSLMFPVKDGASGKTSVIYIED